jgi:hypothetical protein
VESHSTEQSDASAKHRIGNGSGSKRNSRKFAANLSDSGFPGANPVAGATGRRRTDALAEDQEPGLQPSAGSDRTLRAPGLKAFVFRVSVARYQSIDGVRNPLEKNHRTVEQHDDYDVGNQEPGNAAQKVKPHEKQVLRAGDAYDALMQRAFAEGTASCPARSERTKMLLAAIAREPINDNRLAENEDFVPLIGVVHLSTSLGVFLDIQARRVFIPANFTAALRK